MVRGDNESFEFLYFHFMSFTKRDTSRASELNYLDF